MGNRHEYMAPHGCYPCQRVDEWVVLAARDDEDWRSLCRAMGRPELAADPRFRDQLNRHRHQDSLDEIIAQWTEPRMQEAVVAALNKAGIPAAPVLEADQLLRDDHLRQRGLFEKAEHSPESGLGTQEYLGRGWKLSESNPRIQGPAPELGGDNERILVQLLGIQEGEMAALAENEVIGNRLLPASHA